MSQPIILYGDAKSPNPFKVVLILEELGIKYELKNVGHDEVKQKPYTDINPNGRIPAIHDPNTGITIWESGAIIEYLIDTYDTKKEFSFTALEEKYHAIQYLYFQTSGQGPYFGQFVWFSRYHSENVESAKERYRNEIGRITMVLDTILKDREYLVGGKCSFADLSFVPWYFGISIALKDLAQELETKYPNFKAWMARILARPVTRKVTEDYERAFFG